MGTTKEKSAVTKGLAIALQLFAGGSNLYCHSCIYFQKGHCELHNKRMDRLSEACSHYLGKNKV